MKWHHRFMDVAKIVSTWSKDPSTRVGAVLVKDNHIISTGYNGLPSGLDDNLALVSRPFKIKHTIHAERNAIDHAIVTVDGAVMYVTAPPCHACAQYMVDSGIAVVYCGGSDKDFDQRWNVNDSKLLLSLANVPLITLEEETQ